MPDRYIRAASAAWVVACALSAGSLAQAQAIATDATPSTEADSLSQTPEIVVTAQGRSQRLQEVPISISVTTGEQLSQSNIRNLQDLSGYVPAVKIVASATADFVNIRGVGSSANAGLEQSVATFVDGLYRGRSRSTRNGLFDIDRIEVLRGPQTTYFGNNTIAGALSVTTRKPGDDLAVNAIAFYAPNFKQYSFEAGIDIPASDTLKFRVAGRAEGMAGYINLTELGGKGPHLRSQAGRVSMRWEPGSDIKVEARLDIGRQRDTNNFATEAVSCPPDPAFGAASGSCARYIAGVGLANVDAKQDLRSASGPSFFRQNYVEGALTATIPVGTNTLVLTSGYYYHGNNLFYDAQAVPVPYRAAPVVNSTIGLSPNYYETFRQVSQEVRLRSLTGGLIEYQLGVYVAHARSKFDHSVGYYYSDIAARIGRSGDAVAQRVLNSEQSTSASGFGALTINATDKLKLNAGLRYTSVDKSAHRVPMTGYVPSKGTPGPDTFVQYPAAQEAQIFLAFGNQIGDFARPQRTDAKLTPAASIEYKLTPDVMLFATYAKGFKAGAYSTSTTNAILEPESVDNFEVGFKSTLFNNRVTLNLSAFHSKYKNLQEAITTVLPSGLTVGSVANVASSVSKGIEGQITIRLIPELTIHADASYLDAHYLDYDKAPCTQLQTVIFGRIPASQRPAACTQNLAGVTRAFAPRWSGNVGFDYNQPLNDRLRLKISGSTYFSSRYFLSSGGDPYLSQAGNAKIDARIAIGEIDGKWELAVVGKNLTNNITSSYALSMVGAAGTFIRLPDAPRSVGFQGSVRF